MTAPVAEQLRTFHITGHGLEEAVPALTVEAITHGQPLPALEDHYPIRLASGLLVPFDADAAVTLPIAALLDARAPRHAAFIDTVRRTAERLEDLLALDASHDVSAPLLFARRAVVVFGVTQLAHDGETRALG